MEQKPKTVSPISNEGRNAYVAEHLTAALLELLKEKQLADISISELCDGAGVGRTSFYRNFETKEDILKGYIERLFHGWMDMWNNNPGLPLDKGAYNVFSHFEANREFYALLNERGQVYLMKDIILELCGFNPDQDPIPAYSSAYVAFFLYGWIEVWFRRGMRETAELSALLRERGN